MAALSKTIARSLAAVGIGTYDATDDRGRRRPPHASTTSEDVAANARHRAMLSATNHDMARNFIVAKWLIRKHLDYVSSFSFQVKTKDRGFNAYLEAWWKRRTTREAFDIAGRHPHRRAVRLAEACRVLDGDVGWLKLAPGKGHPNRGKIQAIEGSRIKIGIGELPKNTKPEDWINGVRVDQDTGRSLSYAISRRVGKSRMNLDRIVPAQNMIMHACYEFRYDQVRGVSPLAAGLNWLKDTYEGFEYTNAKMKLSQLFGLSIYSNTQEMEWKRDEEGYEDIDFKQRGPFVMEMDEGDRAEVIESKATPRDTNDYLSLLILICLKALDIPFSFWDESFTNFYGSRGGLIQYQKSSADRIADMRDFLSEHCDWVLAMAVADGDLELPSGLDLDSILYEFVPAGVPWWDPVKEVRGAAMAIASGLSSPQRECRMANTDFEQNILEIKSAMEFAEEQGVPLTYADSTAFAPEVNIEVPENAQ